MSATNQEGQQKIQPFYSVLSFRTMPCLLKLTSSAARVLEDNDAPRWELGMLYTATILQAVPILGACVSVIWFAVCVLGVLARSVVFLFCFPFLESRVELCKGIGAYGMMALVGLFNVCTAGALMLLEVVCSKETINNRLFGWPA